MPNKNNLNLKNFSYLDQNNDNLVHHIALKDGNYCYETADGIFITSQPIKPYFLRNCEELQKNVITPQFKPEQYYQQQQIPNIVCKKNKKLIY